jgi:hypothetical protein
MMQGYLISRPVPASDLGRFLKQHPYWHLESGKPV